MHRFILSGKLSLGELSISDYELIHQIKDVLRLKVGEDIIICDGFDSDALATILEIRKNNLQVKILSIEKNKREASRLVTLYCAILKRENFEWVVQKAEEVGVKKIVPIITERTIKSALNITRLKKIVKEAAEQSGRGTMLEICHPLDFSKILKDLPTGQMNLFCNFGGAQLSTVKIKAESIGIWVGPEGGWSESEHELAKANNFKIISLGDTVLRAETAATIGSFLAVNL